MSWLGALPAGVSSIGQMATTSQPQQAFTWGAAGRRRTPEDIAAERQIAESLMQEGADYSPIQSWTQGLARLSQGLVGGLKLRDARRDADENAAYNEKIVQSLMSPGGEVPAPGGAPNGMPPIASLLADPALSKSTRGLVESLVDRQMPKQTAPHYWETNNGSLGMVGADGRPQVIYQDPNAKMNFIPDGKGGGQWVAVPNTPVMGGGGQSAPAPVGPVGKLTPIGGPTPRASAGFR